MSLRLIYEPSVYVIGMQTVDDEAVFNFLHEQTDAPNWVTDTEVAGQELAEIAGRVCYMSFKNPRPGGNKGYLDHIIESGHGRILEHAVFTFIIAGISRTLSHELYTHTVGFSKSQLSQRYVGHEDVAFVVPPALADEVRADRNRTTPKPSLSAEETCGMWWAHMVEQSQRCYEKMSDYLSEKYAHISDKTARRKLAREAARSVLPGCTETKVVCTANVRAIRNFIEQRATIHADAEINRLAICLLMKMFEAAPNLFGDYVIKRELDGREVVSTPHRKV